MRAKDIKQGEIYRLKDQPNYGYIKVICVLKPKERLFFKDLDGFYRFEKNDLNKIVVKAMLSTSKDFEFGFIRSFLPREIIKDA